MTTHMRDMRELLALWAMCTPKIKSFQPMWRYCQSQTATIMPTKCEINITSPMIGAKWWNGVSCVWDEHKSNSYSDIDFGNHFGFYFYFVFVCLHARVNHEEWSAISQVPLRLAFIQIHLCNSRRSSNQKALQKMNGIFILLTTRNRTLFFCSL